MACCYCPTCEVVYDDDDIEICPKCLNHIKGDPVEDLFERVEELKQELAGARHEHTRLAEAAEELLEALGAGSGDMPALLREQAAHIREAS